MVTTTAPSGEPVQACTVCARRFRLFVWRHPCKTCHRPLCARCDSKSNHLCPACAGDQVLGPMSSAGVVAPAVSSVGLKTQILPESPGSTMPATPASPPPELPTLGTAQVTVGIEEARGLVKGDRNIMGQLSSSDPYVVITVPSADDPGVQMARTGTVKNTVNPQWSETFSFETPVKWVRLEVWDEDAAARDDKLGEAEICLDACTRGEVYDGWVRLNSAEGSGQFGMVHVLIRVDSTMMSEFMGNIRSEWRQMYEVKPVLPPFNVDELYTPSMTLKNILGERLILPAATKAGDLVMWKSVTESSLAVVVWVILSRYFRFWPTLVCWGVAAIMAVMPPKRRRTTRSQTTDDATADVRRVPSLFRRDSDMIKQAAADAPTEESLGGFVNFTAKSMPGNLKDNLRTLQQPLRAAANGAELVYDAFHWHSSLSLPLFRSLVFTGAVLLFLPFWVVVMAIGLTVLLALSPLTVAARAVVALVSGVNKRGSLRLEPEFDPITTAL
jgi:hypothetical protein